MLVTTGNLTKIVSVVFWASKQIHLTVLNNDSGCFRMDRENRLKRRLTLDFPQIVFHSLNKHNICQLVFAELLSEDKFIDELRQPSGTKSSKSKTQVSHAESDTENRSSANATWKTTDDTKTLDSKEASMWLPWRDSTVATSMPVPGLFVLQKNPH